MSSVRMDKWLWAARFFKTRALAARACELGRIQSNGQLAKPARPVAIGDMLRVTNAGRPEDCIPWMTEAVFRASSRRVMVAIQ